MKRKSCYVFIDASNLFYGGEKRLNWKVDYNKLSSYLKHRYRAEKIFYYSGVETHNFDVRLRSNEPYPINKLLKYLRSLEKNTKYAKRRLLEKDIAKVKFLQKIESFGYILKLKPIKHIRKKEGGFRVKANCDVDLTLDMVRHQAYFNSFILFSGDGDFEILVKYFCELDYDFKIVGNAENTARRIKEIYHRNFIDFSTIREIIDKK